MTTLRSTTLALVAVLLFVSGCAYLKLKPIPHDGEVILEPDRQFQYYDKLKDKPRASLADAARLTTMLLDKEPWYKDVKTLRTILLEAEVIEEDWEISEAAPLTKGKLAYMMVYTAQVRTSLIMLLTYPTERYALREAVYHELMFPSSPYRYVSGKELLDTVVLTGEFIDERANR